MTYSFNNSATVDNSASAISPQPVKGAQSQSSPATGSAHSSNRGRRRRITLAVLTAEGLSAGTLAVVDQITTNNTGTKVGLLVAIALFLGTALQAIAKSAREIALNEDDLSKAQDQIVDAQITGEKTARVATAMQEYFDERMPSLLDYLGQLVSTDSVSEQRAMAESLESLVVDSAASLYGKKDLRAIILHYRNGDLIPGKFRRGFESTTIPKLDGSGPAISRAKQMIRENKAVWVDIPDDPRHTDSLIMRPSDSYRSFVRIPIVAGDFGFGLLWVDGRNDRSLMHGDVASLSTLAGVLATALAVTASSGSKMNRVL